MSDGSSSTQNGVIGDQEVAVVDSLDSITTTNSDEEEGSSDCNSDIGSSYLSDEEPVSIVTNITSVNSPDEEEEQVDEKSPTANRIAKDTGCCLYSAITAIFVMVVLLGIVLIVTGPVLGLSFPPLLRTNTPTILPPIEHNYLTANFSDDDTIHPPDADYAEQYDSGEGYNNDTLEYADYVEVQTNLTDYVNNTAAIFNDSVIEDLANLSPEALRTKYVAYVPIPLKIDDDQQTEYVDDTDMNDRIDDYQNDDDYDEQSTPRSSSSRRRPTVDKVLLPIIMVPSEEDKSSPGSDSWRFNDQDPARRFDELEMPTDDEEQDLTSSSSRRIHGLNPPRRRPSAPGIDYRMFGSLNHEDNRRNKRPYRPRDRFRPRDDFGRTTSLHPHRVLPPASRSRSRINKGNRQRAVEGREGSPPLYIRPPPRPRPRTPARQRVHRPPVPESWPIRKRTNDPPPPVTKKPAYSYPRDAMSIQDIISYMTSMSHSNDQTTKKPLAPAGPEHRSAVWENQDYYSNNQRRGGPYPSILPAPPSMGISRSQDNLPVESHTRRVPPDPVNPYSFKLDVYPIRDNLGRGSSSSPSNNVPPGPSYREQSVLPPTNYRYRPGNYESDTSGIDFSYKLGYRQSDGNNWSYSSYSSSSADAHYYRPQQRRPSHHGSQEQAKYRDNDDDMPLPLAFRPRRPQSITTAKPKLIVHLNVFNQNKGGRNRYAEDRRDDEQGEEEEEYYSPSDIYRAVLRNNAAKTNRDHQVGGDMTSGQSRVDTFSQHQTNAVAVAVDPSPSSSFNSYDSHNMAVSASQDQYYKSVDMRRSSPSVANSGNNYRISHQSRNFYPAIDDDVPEPLPMPMASSSDCNSCNFQGSVDNTQTLKPLVS